MKNPCTGVILSGGLSTRYSGRDKAAIAVGGKCILDRIYSVFADLFDEIILVTNSPLRYLAWDLNIVPDLFPDRSSLTGIHAGLFFMTRPYAFVSACDTPFLKKELVETVVAGIAPNVDIVIPETSAGDEPLCAVYSKRCLQPAEQHLAQKKFKVQWAFRKNRVKKIPESVLRARDPELVSFFNVNTPGDLARAQQLAREIEK